VKPTLAFLAALLIAGCSSSPAGVKMDGPEPGTRALTVDAWGSSPQVQVERPVSTEEFLERVDRLLRAGRKNAAERLIRRYPDVSLQALSEAPTRPARSLPVIAQVHERQCGTGPGGWPDLLRDRSERREHFNGIDAERELRLRMLREGRFLEAAEVDVDVVPGDSPASALMRIDLWKLRGLAFLLAEKPAEAAAAFRAASEPARISRPYEAAHLLLLLGEAQLRAGKSEAAAAAWTDATEKAVPLSMEAGELVDPGFWERAIHLKPSAALWSPRVGAMVRELGDRRLGVRITSDADAESGLWGLIGLARLLRGESRGALMAFSRGAGAGSVDEKLREANRVGQARALARQGELSSAKAMLVPSAAKPGTGGIPALALLGALELRSGDAPRASVILKKALEEPEAADWPGRADAEANFGLALLSTGKEAEGLKWLRSAESRFEAEKDPEGLVQALRNELRYLEDHARDREGVEVRERLKTVE